MKIKYFIKLSYLGTRYCGWQIQPNAESIQSVLEKAFSTILQEDIAITGAGRTDAGVHAKNFIAHFESEKVRDVGKLKYSLNHFLPSDIAIHGIFPVHPDAHARFSAMSRRYEYWFIREKNPFYHHRAWLIPYSLDIEMLNRSSQILKDYKDFTSFARLHSDAKTNLCEINSVLWKEEGDRVVFSIEADRFLRNMVRAIVGTFTDLARGKITEAELRRIVEAKDRSLAGASAPAHGLYLCNIAYPHWVWNSETK